MSALFGKRSSWLREYFILFLIFCGLYMLLVSLSTGGKAINSLYFYPKSVQQAAVERGLATKAEIKTRKIQFAALFYLILLIA